MKKISVLIIFCFLFLANKGYSQQSYFSASYDIGFGSGDLNDYISKTSFRGATLGYRGYINNNVVAGVDIGWNVFYEKMDYDTYTVDTRSLSGVQYRYSNMAPIFAVVDYMIKPGEDINPFVGFGLGTMYTDRETDMGLFMLKETAWHFAIKPEVGAIIDYNRAIDLKLSAQYIVGFEAGDLPTQSYFSLSLGCIFKQY
jgi:outer membrane protein